MFLDNIVAPKVRFFKAPEDADRPLVAFTKAPQQVRCQQVRCPSKASGPQTFYFASLLPLSVAPLPRARSRTGPWLQEGRDMHMGKDHSWGWEQSHKVLHQDPGCGARSRAPGVELAAARTPGVGSGLVSQEQGRECWDPVQGASDQDQDQNQDQD